MRIIKRKGPVNNLSYPIRDKRVSIRSLGEGDLEDLYALETDVEVKRYLGGPIQRPRDEWLNLLRAKLGAENCPLIIELNEDGSFVGRASFAKTMLQTTSHATPLLEGWKIEVLIGRNFWSRGFGNEVANSLIKVAFEFQDVTSIVSVVHPENQASLRLMTALGFENLGTKISSSLDHGHVVFHLERPID
ncbi:MAG: GNAT family N-acetyltransferase [Methylocella sp.]|jgi:RimJ/RimL family protein N-acetyltransferase